MSEKSYQEAYELWWSANTEDRHEKIFSLVDQIKNDQRYRERDNLHHLKLYIKRDYETNPDGFIEPAGASPRIGINAVKSAVDTVCARVTQQDPRPKISTEGGRWEQRRKARKLQQFVDGVFKQTDYYYKLRRAFKDAAIFGTGFLKPFFEDGSIHWERVMPGEVHVDESSAMNGEPRSYFQEKLVSMESLVASFPDSEADILTSGLVYNLRSETTATPLLRVIEAWHIRDKSKKGGRHTICINGATLFDEEWPYDHAPFVALLWNELPVGYYGNGAAEDLHGMQEEIDYLMQRIQTSMHVNAGAWLLKHASDKTPNSHFTNKIGTIIEWSGQHPPELRVNPALHQQVFDHVKWLNELVYNEVGVSQMSATSQKPKGIEAAAALQTLLDVESNRFFLLQKAYEKCVMDCANITIDLARHHYRGSRSEYSVKSSDGRFVSSIKWEDVNMPADEYVLEIWPTNMLPNTPTGKLDTVEKMMQAGLLDAQTGMMLLDLPDLEAHQALSLAAVRHSLWIVDQVIYEGRRDLEPKEWYDLARCVRYMQMGMTNAEMEGAPPEVLEMCMEWIVDAEALQSPPQPPPPIMDPTGAMAPPIDPAMPMDPNMGGMMPPQGAI